MNKAYGPYTDSSPPRLGMELKHESPTSKLSYLTTPFAKSKRTRTKLRHFMIASSSLLPLTTTSIPSMTTPPHVPPFKMLLMPKFTEPSSASSPTKALDLTANPTPSTSTAANFSSHTSVPTTVPPSTSNTTPKHGKHRQPLYSANPTNPTTHFQKHTALSPSSIQSPRFCPP